MNRPGTALQRGLEAYGAGDYQAASEHLEEALQESPGSPRVLMFLGLARMHCGDLPRAVDLLGRAEAEEASAEVAFSRGIVEQSAHRHEAALAAFTRALERGFRRSDAVSGQGSCLALLGRPDAARVLLQEVLRTDPAHPDALYWLAHALAQEREEEGNRGRAVTALEALLARKDVSEWLMGRAHFLLASLLDDSEENFEEAAEHYRAGLAIDPDHVRGRNNLGFLYLRMGRTREAREELLVALELDPRYTRPHRNLARLYYDSLEEASLREDLEELARKLPPAELTEAMVGLVASLTDEARRQAYQDYYDRCHRLKNLLAVSGGRLRRLCKKAPEGSPLAEGLAGLHARHQETYEQLANDLRLLRPSSREAEAVDVNALCRAVVRATRGEGDGRLDVTADLARALPVVHGDREALREALTNLVRNAVEAMEGAGSLQLRTRWEIGASHLEIEVEDSGPGLPEGAGEELFRTGYTTKDHGSGLGLALVRRTVHELRGSVRAGNRSEGGARVTLRLPVQAHTPDGRRLGLAARPVRLEDANQLDVDELTS